MVPFWKIKRELNRIKDQFLQLPLTVSSMPGRLREPKRRAAYLREFDTVTKRHAGRLPSGDRIAIFLIFQPNGISPSTIATCEWLVSEGFSPFIVSNCAVSEVDRHRLLDLCWSLLERPNFGYDFGGYQDAIRLLNRDGLQPERLIVMNDSVWAPMRPDLLAQIETNFAEADICGLLHDEKVIHDTRGGQPSKRSHVESYFYLIRRSAWDHPAFQAFWRDYEMTDFKPHTIKYGEIGFSRKMASAGLKLDAFSRRELFLQRLREKDDAFLRQTLLYAAYADPDLIKSARRVAGLDPDSAGWRDAALEHIRRSVNRKRFNASFPFANDHIFGTVFMKKSREPIFVNMRAAYLRALEDGVVSAPPDVIRDEIVALARKAP